MKNDIYFATLVMKDSDRRNDLIRHIYKYLIDISDNVFIATVTDTKEFEYSGMYVKCIWQFADYIESGNFVINGEMALIIEESNSNDFTYLVNEFTKVGAKVILLKNAN
jgi:hypothetical protein